MKTKKQSNPEVRVYTEVSNFGASPLTQKRWDVIQEVALHVLIERCPGCDIETMNSLQGELAKFTQSLPDDLAYYQVKNRSAAFARQWLKKHGLWVVRERDRLVPLGFLSTDSERHQGPELEPERVDELVSKRLTDLSLNSSACSAYLSAPSASLQKEHQAAKEKVASILDSVSDGNRQRLDLILRDGGPGSLRETAPTVGLKHPQELKRFYEGIARESRHQPAAVRRATSASLSSWTEYDPPVVRREVIMSIPGMPCVPSWADYRSGRRTRAERSRNTGNAVCDDIYDLRVPRNARTLIHRQWGVAAVLEERITDSGPALVLSFPDGTRRIVLCGEEYFDPTG